MEGKASRNAAIWKPSRFLGYLMRDGADFATLRRKKMCEKASRQEIILVVLRVRPTYTKIIYSADIEALFETRKHGDANMSGRIKRLRTLPEQ